MTTSPTIDCASDGPLVFGHLFDGEGGGTSINWSELAKGLPKERTYWLHLDRSHEEARAWMTENLGVEDYVLDELFDEDTRPRCTQAGSGLLINLRGVNLNDGADPTDMLALRLWVTEEGVITLRKLPLRSVAKISDQLHLGQGPTGPGDLVASISYKLMSLMEPTMRRFDTVLNDAELSVVENNEVQPPSGLAESRRGITALRRYLKPQAEALTNLINLGHPAFSERDLAIIGNAKQDVLRFVEHLEEMREKVNFIYDEISKSQNDRINRTMYRLTVITAVFLPLGFITGLLGINVGGMPGTESGSAFWVVCALLTAIAFAVYGFFRLIGYLGRS